MESPDEPEAILRGQAHIWRQMFAFADSMALKCAVELRIPDIIHSYGGGPVTLAQIASRIPAPSPGTTYLARIMRLLVRNNIFSAQRCQPDGGHESQETLYGITPSSRWLLQGPGSELSLAPLVLMENHPWLMSPWHCFSDCIKTGGVAFEMAHGCKIWDFASANPEFNRLFNDGMAGTSKILVRAIVEGYKAGFKSIGSLVDVGGGIGVTLATIIKSFPHIQGINFDLPHVIATAPAHDGITHVGGDMFETIPHAEAVFMKGIMHDWGNEDCVKILRNCRKAIPEKNGKVIIVDVVLKPEGNGMFDEIGTVLDLVMMAHCSGGKERDELEWKNIVEKGGFPRYNIIKTSSLLFIIEAYPL
ncbi:xanthohumol 4-O-methyltransferase-like isoform X1 [Rhodamnia argentea]|uniref:Xanthohumol 4-O-methyltransferase-like isoform X1 n=1 Tax=Rhodamnia argentea TaxID=178133 RepID=A0ABM3HMM1_9MYRT|nr:xanthohumol 4-O-methyltransferase-like isoform X1 [Rhodamnia argentea]